MSFKPEENNGDNNGFELVDRPSTVESALMISPPATTPLFFSTSTPLPVPAPVVFPVPQNQASTNPAATSSSLAFSTISPIQPMAPPAPLVFPAAPITSESSEKPLISAAAAAQPSSAISNEEEANKPSAGLFGWVSGLPGKGLLSKVAEKARSSVDTLVTTLDPQMKEFIYSGGDIDILVASAKDSKVGAIREAFQEVFGKATVRGIESQSTLSAAQPVGFASALQGAEERVSALRSSGQVQPELPIVAVEGFVVELYPNNWFEMCCLLLDDPSRSLRLHAFTQPLSVPSGVVSRMQNATSGGYPHRQSGFAVTVGQAVNEELNVSSNDWQLTLHGVPRRQLISLAAKSLAFAYKKSRGHQI